MIRTPKKRVTIRDLARELDLSPRAVSQALNPRRSTTKVSPETVKRIQKLAQERNFLPDSRARTMRSGRFNNIGYFEAKLKADSWPLLGVESGVSDVASERHCRVSLIRLPTDLAKSSSSIPSIFREGNIDALILSHAGNLSSELEEVIDASGFPVVYLNEKKRRNAVYVDDRRSGFEITQHIIAQGKRQIMFLNISNNPFHYSIIDRKLGYQQAMEKAGLKSKVVEENGISETDSEMKLWMHDDPKLEAIVANNDFTALQVFRAIRRSEFVVPKNLLLTGFGDDFGSTCSPIPLTTMRIPFYEMGRAAAEMALDLVEKNLNSLPSKVFRAELIVRESTSF